MHPRGPHSQNDRDHHQGDGQGGHVAVLGEHDRDDDQGDQVVDHGDGEDEGAQAVREAASHDGQHPQRKRGVGRHRRAPARPARAGGVDEQVDRHRHHHPAQTGQHRQGQPAAVAQLAEVELAPGLQPDDEEEQVMSPSLTHWRRSWLMPPPPMRIDSVVCQTRL